MQFSCESCKATLQIADEKVRGKRLVVRCKRCGAKITISDPALSAAARPAPRPAPAPAPALAPVDPGDDGEHDSDTESTRAMDSDLLEKALQASKRDDSTSAGSTSAGSTSGSLQPVQVNAAPPAPAPAPSRPPPPPPVQDAQRPAPRDPPIWFAMLGGKQAGPLSRAELGLKLAQGQLGPRTYIWKEGMGSWQRAKDVPELSAMFAPAPEPRAPEARAPAPPPQGAHGLGDREFSTQDFGAIDLSSEEKRRTRERAESEFSTQDFGSLDLGKVAGDPTPAQAPRAAAAAPVQAPRAAAAAPAPARRAPAPPVPSAEGLAPVRLGEPDDEDRTSVEDLPLGERVHQESVASELFSSGEHARGQSAVDLARWASSELGKQKPAAGSAPRVAPKDPFSSVPDSPDLVLPTREDRTGDVLLHAGVKKSRAPLVAFVVVAVVVILGALVWALSNGSAETGSARNEPAAGEPGGPAKPAPLGGTGDKSVDGLAATPDSPAAEAPGPAAGKAPVAAVPVKPARKAEGKPAALTDEQETALKSLDNERGIGTHGPRGEATQAPAVAKADSGLTADDVRKKLDENKGALQGCIDEALRREPNLRVGKIHIATTIASSGTVTAAHIDKRTVDDSALGACLKRATRRIVFPSFAGDAFDVDIPIVVTAGD